MTNTQTSEERVRAEFEAWALETRKAFRDKNGLWFYAADQAHSLWTGYRAASASRSELLQAAKAVAFSNGFDAAYQDKLETLRSVVRKYQGE